MENKRVKGAYYEQLAAEYLRHNGYAVLERNFRNRTGEIDIIAMDSQRKELCFIEVKYRTGDQYGRPAAAVGYKKQQTIVKVSNYYTYIRHMSSFQRRYDVIEFTGNRLDHIINAFSG